MIGNLLKKLPSPLQGEMVSRKETCRCCGSGRGRLIAVADYWDIRTSDIVQCDNCRLIQFDPMLTEDETARGCAAYYNEESLRVPLKEQQRNMLRSFRRGVLFAWSLKRYGFTPGAVLELGPGSGYFLAGIKYIFPGASISVMDVNPEILAFISRHHAFDTYQSTPESVIDGLKNKFDLVIARDLLEHVTDISKVLDNVIAYAQPGGLFHFITPNGHADVWKHYLTYHYLNCHSELLINHVNYFDGKGLLEMLVHRGCSRVEYYNYKLKTTLRGSGWKVKRKLMAARSQMRSSAHYLNQKCVEAGNMDTDKSRILRKWYIKDKRKFVAYFVSWYQHASLFRADPAAMVGHETYGLFRTPSEKGMQSGGGAV